MECSIGKYSSPDSYYTDQYILFPPISQLFPFCQSACGSFIKRGYWQEEFCCVYVRFLQPWVSFWDGC